MLSRPDLGLARFQRLVENGVQVTRGLDDSDVTPTDARDIHQVVYQPYQLFELPFQDPVELRELPFRIPCQLQCVQYGADRRQWVAQFVSQQGEKLVLAARHLSALGVQQHGIGDVLDDQLDHRPGRFRVAHAIQNGRKVRTIGADHAHFQVPKSITLMTETSNGHLQGLPFVGHNPIQNRSLLRRVFARIAYQRHECRIREPYPATGIEEYHTVRQPIGQPNETLFFRHELPIAVQTENRRDAGPQFGAIDRF